MDKSDARQTVERIVADPCDCIRQGGHIVGREMLVNAITAALEVKEREIERLEAEVELSKGTAERSDRAFTKLLCNELGVTADESVRKRVDQIVQTIRTYKAQLDEAVRLLVRLQDIDDLNGPCLRADLNDFLSTLKGPKS